MEVIDLADGQPDVALLPNDLILTATQHLLAQGKSISADGSSEALAYGDFTFKFRNELASFIGRTYDRTPPAIDRLMLTAGVSQGLDLVCTMLAQEGDIVFVEEPTYFLAFDIFRDHKLDVRPCLPDESGSLLPSLRQQLSALAPQDSNQTAKKIFLYLVPTHSNPNGKTLTTEAREELVRVTQEHGVTVLADEVYHLLSWSAEPMPQSLATFGTSVCALPNDSIRILYLILYQ
jgi:DNA-binding transcriptional MocR family regulator